MAKAREGHGETIAVPPPVPLDRVRRRWDEFPELACVAAWQAACQVWWDDREDRRLRTAVLDALFLDDAELAVWLRRGFDTDTLLRAHSHVTALRAGVETDLSIRTLVTGSLRTYPVWTEHHDGTRRMFAAAEDVRRHLECAASDFQKLPAHPFIRAAWLSQVLGVIHPFRDANGGTARFLASLELARNYLPPLRLSVELRNGMYIEAIAVKDSLDPLALVVYEAVQQGLANALLARHATPSGLVAWTDHGRARANEWMLAADRRMRVAIGGAMGIERDDAQPDAAIARIIRSGYRMPAFPSPTCATWRISSPVPARIDLAVVPLRGGATSWLGAIISGRAGGGELGPVLDREHVAMYFVAPDCEPDEIAGARFLRWVGVRVEQTVRGLLRWM